MISPETQNTTVRERLPVFEGVLSERLRPTVTKQMGFQSYEKLEDNGEVRKDQEIKFLAGEVRNPSISYPRIDPNQLILDMIPLKFIIEQAEYFADDRVKNAIQTSALYRQNEMLWLMKAHELDQLKDKPDSKAFLEVADKYQSMNEALYGIPRAEIIEKVYGELFVQKYEKPFTPEIQKIYDELIYGTTVHIQGKEIEVLGIGEQSDETDRLPTIDKETLSDLSDYLKEKCGYIYDLTEVYWKKVIEPRITSGGESGFTPQDMVVLFEAVLTQVDADGATDISIALNPDKTALAWDTPTMSVQVGGKRRRIFDTLEMAGLIVHELYVHGGRAVAGLASPLVVLGTGLYTQANFGESADYLTFEEGFATICELAVQKKEEDRWDATGISRYLAAASVYEGMDFRQTYERNWRARVVMSFVDGELDKPNKGIKYEQKQAYISTLRLMRGTPTEMVDKPVLTFNKDLAYLEGKIKVLGYLKSIKGDRKALEKLFIAKFDPTNKTQDKLVDIYGIRDNR